jgi:hypothetical protein
MLTERCHLLRENKPGFVFNPELFGPSFGQEGLAADPASNP